MDNFFLQIGVDMSGGDVILVGVAGMSPAQYLYCWTISSGKIEHMNTARTAVTIKNLNNVSGEDQHKAIMEVLVPRPLMRAALGTIEAVLTKDSVALSFGDVAGILGDVLAIVGDSAEPLQLAAGDALAVLAIQHRAVPTTTIDECPEADGLRVGDLLAGGAVKALSRLARKTATGRAKSAVKSLRGD